MTGIDALHAESKTLKVENHLRMLCSQFLATCLKPDYASLPIVTADLGPRDMKQIFQKNFRETRENGDLPRIPISFREPNADFFEDGYIQDIQAARKTTHIMTMEDARKPDRVLNVVAPDVNDKEGEDMSRKMKTTMAQLCTGFCSSLYDFQYRINASLSLLPTF